MFKSTILIITLLLVIATKPSAGALDQFLSAFKSVNRMVRNEPVQTSNVVFCNQARLNDKNTDHVVRKYCTGPSFNFSFSAYFHNKDLLKLKNLKRLAQTFSQYSVCEANFMRYNFEAQRLQYFNAGETYLLNEGKILNETSNPQVHIIKDTLQKDKRKIIFECKLPLSDVFLSLNQNEISARKSIHSHPLPMNRATVSGIHVKLNFLQMENLVVNVNTRRLNSEGDMLNQARDQLLNSKKPIERFLVHYDTKCRQCELNGVNFTTPLANDSIRCNLKAKTCEYEGSCYAHGEIYSPFDIPNEDRPNMNAFVCNISYSQTSLFMPCAINNGECRSNQTCTFNASTLYVRCDDKN